MARAGRWRPRGTVASIQTCPESGGIRVCDEALFLNEAAEVQELLPGFAHLRGVLAIPAQQALLNISCSIANESRQLADASGGWYRKAEDNGQWTLNDGSKARFWDSIDRYPPQFKELGNHLASFAAKACVENLHMPSSSFEPRVGALNFYTQRGSMGWHIDDTNFAKPDKPIVMANLGDAADFGYKLRKSDPDQSVRLESGDVIVFGGPARNLVHALLRVHPKTSPGGLSFPAIPGPGRVSVTWRDVGPEDGLTFNSDERLGLRVTENTLPRYLRRPASLRSHATAQHSNFRPHGRRPG